MTRERPPTDASRTELLAGVGRLRLAPSPDSAEHCPSQSHRSCPMPARGPAFRTSPTNPGIGEIHTEPARIKDQTRRAMDTIKTILDHQGLAWTDVVKVTKYLTDMRDMDGMVAVMAEYFGDWTPASTTVCVHQLR